MLTFDGRAFNSRDFGQALRSQAIDAAMAALKAQFQDLGGSLIDPLTGKHPLVFVRRVGEANLLIKATGSTVYAIELERRMGVERGSVTAVEEAPAKNRLVYLAHASEDHESLARPIAEGLLERGIDVWLDEWEIRTGHSLRQRMEQGLGDCTHFLVLLTENSIGKPWVNEEIDAGFVSAVNGQSVFMAVRNGLGIDRLSPFLRSKRCPEVTINREAMDALVADILDVSRKPPVGAKPRYFNEPSPDLSFWAQSAQIVAKYLVVNSDHGGGFDPQVTTEAIQEETGLPEEDVRIGVLDLVGAGLIERDPCYGSTMVWPKRALFVEFDATFTEHDPEKDAVSIANYLYSEKIEDIELADLGAKFGWAPRRLNPAVAFLVEGNVVDANEYSGSDYYEPAAIATDDRLIRFVRDRR